MINLFFIIIFLGVTPIQAKTSQSNHDNCTKLQSKVVYIIEQDDFLSDILQTFQLTPLWGRSHFVRKSLKINRLRNPDFILTGNELEIPFQCEEDAQRFPLINKEGVRQIDSTKLVKVKTVKVSDGKKMVFQYPDGTRIPYDEGEPGAPKNLNGDSYTNKIKNDTAINPDLDKTENYTEAKAPQRLKKYFSVGLLSGFRKLDSTDLNTEKKSTLLSQPLFGAHLDFSVLVRNQIKAGIFYNYQYIKFIQADSTEVKNSQSSLSSLGTFLENKFERMGTFRVKAIYGEYQFLTGSSSSGVTLRKFWRPSAGIDYLIPIYKNNSLDLHFVTSYQNFFSTDNHGQNLKSGHGLSFGPNINTTLLSKSFDIGIMYSQFSQKSQDYEQTDHHIGLSGILKF
jgi:hypothetical protein